MGIRSEGPDFGAELARLGFGEFRPGQREAIEALFEVGRALLVAPTGGGKSLCYQLPAKLLPGTTLVVSPLIALMHDQVRALDELGIPATFLASTVPAEETRARLRDAARGKFKLVYVAPERLRLASFRRLLADLDCPLVAVDEAHCISEWGHDFRPDYLEIGGLISAISGVRVLACTATATPLVRDEVLLRLGLPPDTPQIVRGFARPELRLSAREVSGARERRDALDAQLEHALGDPASARGGAIVYAPTRKATDREAERLEQAGWRAGGYHAGMTGPDRDRIQSRFLARELDVVVATNAFGMGIDRPDVRAVVHLSPPGSVEAYYQEVGRAGRDGAEAFGLLLVSPEDPPRRRRLIELDGQGQPLPSETVEHRWSLYLELLRFVSGGSCRHDAILRYFGDEDETLAGCGHCDVCERLDEPDAADEAETTEIVRKALSAVARVHGRFGLKAAIHLLRGKDDERLARSGLDRSSTFGILAERSDEWLMRLFHRLVTAGWVGFTGDERPVTLLTETGGQVMREERPARVLLPPPLRARTRRASPAAPRAGAPARSRKAPASDLAPGEQDCFEALRRLRQQIAARLGIPAYVVAQDRTLRDIAELRPSTPAELELAWGMGPKRARRFGKEFLAVVAETGSSVAAS